MMKRLICAILLLASSIASGATLMGNSDYAQLPWTPTDGSGQGLTLTLNDAWYIQIGVNVSTMLDITFPTNTNAQYASIAGLPLVSVGGSPGGGSCYFSDYGIAVGGAYSVGVKVPPGSSSLLIYRSDGSKMTNGMLSGRRLACMFLYKGSPPTGVNVVFIGDSITAQWWLNGYQNGVINKGIGGQTSQQMLARFQTDVIALAPREVHILAGTNDIIINQSLDTSAVSSMAAMAQAAGIRPILATIPPMDPSVAPDWMVRQWNTSIVNLAAANGYSVVDYYNSLILPDGAQNVAEFRDLVHPNVAGFDVMWSLAVKAL